MTSVRRGDERQPVRTPSWLTAALDQRLAQMDTATGGALPLMQFDMVLMPLTEPEEDATPAERERWEFTCDNCGKYAPSTMLSGDITVVHRGMTMAITLGACPECWELD